jgi:hypothetical protein
MPEDLRTQLKAAATNSGRSEGQELLSRLQQSFDWPIKMQKDWGPPHIKGLAQLVVQVSRTVEGAVGVPPLGQPDHVLNWHKDAFTHRALTTAINAVLEHFKPGGKVRIPKAVQNSAARFARVLGHSPARHRRPEVVGLSCAGGVIVQLQTMDLPQRIPPKTRYADAFLRMEQVREDLGIEHPKRRAPNPQKRPVAR